jgi:peptide/nickel transport system permease protein
MATAGLILISVVVLLVLTTPFLPLESPDLTDPPNRLLSPLHGGHLLGTDHLGRDVLSRLLWGTRVSLAVGISATLFAALVGSTIGLVSGFHRGNLDNLLMRGIDILTAMPYILLALAIVAVLGPSLMNALYAIAAVNIPYFARNIRGITLGLACREFVDAARLVGKSDPQILVSEILPNVMPTIVIAISTTVGWMILETAGLSFLGLGAQPPQADLGSMLGEARKLLITAPYISVIPGLMIFVLVISINLVGDGIRDMLDPRLASGTLARPAPITRVSRHTTRTTAPAPQAPEVTLSVRDLRTEFRIGRRVHRAVGGVSFELRENECLGLVGESGSGKSVTALSLLGLVPTPPGCIAGGQVLFKGRDLLSQDIEGLRAIRGNQIAYVFQDPQTTLHPLFTVGAQIVEALRVHRPLPFRDAWLRAVELLDLVRIPNAAARSRAYPHELSGGMRQRVAIAMALANDPGIIVADEPTTALDVTVQAQILGLLRQLRRAHNATLLFISHDFGVVSQLCDRVAVMYAGRIVEMGMVGDVLGRPAHPYTSRLIDCVPKPDRGGARVEPIAGLPPKLDELPDGCAFADRCDFVEASCRSGEIELRQVGTDHLVRCRKPLALPS